MLKGFFTKKKCNFISWFFSLNLGSAVDRDVISLSEIYSIPIRNFVDLVHSEEIPRPTEFQELCRKDIDR